MPSKSRTRRKQDKKKFRSGYRFCQLKLQRSQKNSKKILKIKKRHSCIIFAQVVPGEAENAIKIFSHRIQFLPYPKLGLSPQNSKKILK